MPQKLVSTTKILHMILKKKKTKKTILNKRMKENKSRIKEFSPQEMLAGTQFSYYYDFLGRRFNTSSTNVTIGWTCEVRELSLRNGPDQASDSWYQAQPVPSAVQWLAYVFSYWLVTGRAAKQEEPTNHFASHALHDSNQGRSRKEISYGGNSFSANRGQGWVNSTFCSAVGKSCRLILWVAACEFDG